MTKRLIRFWKIICRNWAKYVAPDRNWAKYFAPDRDRIINTGYLPLVKVDKDREKQMTEPQTIKLEISSEGLIGELNREIKVLLVTFHKLEERIDAIEQHPALSIPPLKV